MPSSQGQQERDPVRRRLKIAIGVLLGFLLCAMVSLVWLWRASGMAVVTSGVTVGQDSDSK